MSHFQENIPLSGVTNYRIGGPAAFFFEARTPEEVLWAVEESKKRGLRLFILGAGTNVLVSDEGFHGLVLRPNITSLEVEGTAIRAGAGMLVADVLQAAAEAGLAGLEWAGGLPGTLGGAIRGNAGAFGGEIKDIVAEVESLDTETLQFIKRAGPEAKFGYRSSIYKEGGGREIILSATLLFRKGDAEEIRKVIEARKAYRAARHPLEYPNVGSVFKNIALTHIYTPDSPDYAEAVRAAGFMLRDSRVPVKIDPFPVVPTAYLISEAGLKGASHGGAMVSPKHPNFIVNALEARAEDVKSLIGLVKEKVKDTFGVILEEEVHILENRK